MMTGALPDKPRTRSVTFWGILAVVLGIVGQEVASLETWKELLTPAVLSRVLLAIGGGATAWGFRRKMGANGK